MSERHVSHAESKEHHDSPEAKQRSKELLNEAKRKAAEATHHGKEHIDDIRAEIEKQASASNELSKDTLANEEPEGAHTYWYSAEYRNQAYQKTLNSLRKNLSGPDKLVSKIIHRPLVEKVSEVGSKTIARPSGVLVGSIFSCVSSALIYFLFKRYGYDMTYSVFIVTFLVGFLVGVAGEFSLRAVRSLLERR